MGYLTKKELENLKTFKYETTGYSALDNYMNYFWEWFVKLIPLSVAANTLTLLGMIWMMLSYFVMVPFDTTFSAQIPCNICFLSALFQFLYQTFDAVDGKQARRTGTQGPLGMILDHGADSASNIFVILALLQALALNEPWIMVIAVVIIQGVMYFCTWEELWLHKTRTQIGNMGVTEAQFIQIGVTLITGVFGYTFWDDNQIFGIAIKYLALSGNIVFGIWIMGSVLVENWSVCKSTVRAQADLIPYIMHQLLLAYWLQTALFDTHAWIILLMHGFAFSKMVLKLLISATTSHPFPIVHPDVVMLYMGAGIASMGIASEAVVFAPIWLFIILDYCRFVYVATNEIAEFLGVKVFN